VQTRLPSVITSESAVGNATCSGSVFRVCIEYNNNQREPLHNYRAPPHQFLTTMAETRITPQDFQTVQRPKRKRSAQPSTSQASPTFVSHNQFSVLSDSESDFEEKSTPLQSTVHSTRIPPIVVYSLLTNHSSTLSQVNQKLTSPVEVKSKTNRLLLYTKSSSDYKILLSEIQAASLAYHTYPLPDEIQPRLVLKGIPPNVPEEDIRTDLIAQNIQVIRISQITKMDKVTREIITKYPVYVVTLPPGTDLRKVHQIQKLCHCIVSWEKFKNSRPIRQCYNCQSFGHSSKHCGKPAQCVKCSLPHATKECSKPTGSPPKCSNCGGDHPANFTGCPKYVQQLQFSQRPTNHRQRAAPTPQPSLSSAQHNPYTNTRPPPPHTPHPPRTWANVVAQPPPAQNQPSSGSIIESIKSILSMFDIQKLCNQVKALASQLQATHDPVSKLVMIVDTVINCLSPSP
jgi:PAX-interacting protein 1